MTFADKTERDVNAAIAQDLKFYSRRRWPMANDKFRKSRLASLLNVTERRIKSLWEADERAVIREHEAEAVRRLIGQEEANRNDFAALQSRVARLEAALATVDPDFFDHQMAGYREALHAGRGGNVSGAAGRDDRLTTPKG
jgi:hypothetical protein